MKFAWTAGQCAAVLGDVYLHFFTAYSVSLNFGKTGAKQHSALAHTNKEQL